MNHIIFCSECEKLTIQTNDSCFMMQFQSATTEQVFCLPNNNTTIALFVSALDSITENPTFTINEVVFVLALETKYNYNIQINGVTMILDNEASLLFYKFWKELNE